MSPERRALLDALTVERFTVWRPELAPVDETEAREHRDQITPRLRLVRDSGREAS